jgi:hypothetical protein
MQALQNYRLEYNYSYFSIAHVDMCTAAPPAQLLPNAAQLSFSTSVADATHICAEHIYADARPSRLLL